MTNEDLNYIFDILKGSKPIKEPDWYSVLGFLSTHRIEGLFYHKACEIEVPLPQKIKKLLKSSFDKQKRKVDCLRKYVKELSNALINNNVEHVFLKGSVFANTMNELAIYEDGERSSNDIDVLVKPNKLIDATNNLKKMGYIQGTFDEKNNIILPFSRKEIINRRMNRGEVAPFIKLTGNAEFPYVEVDINFSLGNTPNEFNELLERMIDNRILLKADFEIYALNLELFFIHLIMHQYKESCLYFMVSRSKDLDVYKLADIYYLFKRKTFDLKLLNEIIDEYELGEKVGTVLNQVAMAFSDQEMLDFANSYEIINPIIIDYDNTKRYCFNVDVRGRLKVYNSLNYLEEVHEKPFYRWEFPIDYFRGNNK